MPTGLAPVTSSIAKGGPTIKRCPQTSSMTGRPFGTQALTQAPALGKPRSTDPTNKNKNAKSQHGVLDSSNMPTVVWTAGPRLSADCGCPPFREPSPEFPTTRPTWDFHCMDCVSTGMLHANPRGAWVRTLSSHPPRTGSPRREESKAFAKGRGTERHKRFLQARSTLGKTQAPSNPLEPGPQKSTHKPLCAPAPKATKQKSSLIDSKGSY